MPKGNRQTKTNGKIIESKTVRNLPVCQSFQGSELHSPQAEEEVATDALHMWDPPANPFLPPVPPPPDSLV